MKVTEEIEEIPDIRHNSFTVIELVEIKRIKIS